MNTTTLETNNYELSVLVDGPRDSSRLALIHPGFLESCEYSHIKAYVSLFSSLGCRAIAYSAPGIWGSRIREGIEDRHREYSMYRQVDAGFELCTELITENPELKITAVGHSGGGRPAVHEALAFPGNVDSIILDRVGYKWLRPSNEDRKKNQWGKEPFVKNHPDGGPDVEFDVDYDYTERAKDYDIDESIKTLEIPKLQIAGLLDNVAPPHETLLDFGSAAEPKDIVWVPTDHYYLTVDDLIHAPRMSSGQPRGYSNKGALRQNQNIVREWLIRQNLVPHPGRLAVASSLRVEAV